MPDISIIMSTYNEKETELSEAIESILNQTYSDFEFIIVEDNPLNYRLNKLISKYGERDSRIKIIKNEKNIGLALSLNKAIDISTSEFIARMDADDISLENRLYKQITYLNHNNLDLIGSNIMVVTNDGKVVKNTTDFPTKKSSIYKYLRYYDCIPHPTWFGKKEVFLKLNGYRNLVPVEDYDFLLRTCQMNFQLGNVRDICLKYRVRSDGISESNQLKQKLASRFLRKNYNRLAKIDSHEIDKYVHELMMGDEAKILTHHLCLRNQLKEYRNNKIWLLYFWQTVKIILYSKYGRDEAKIKILEYF